MQQAGLDAGSFLHAPTALTNSSVQDCLFSVVCSVEASSSLRSVGMGTLPSKPLQLSEWRCLGPVEPLHSYPSLALTLLWSNHMQDLLESHV